MENYIGSQQHWEDNINADYDERERHNAEQVDDRTQPDPREQQQEEASGGKKLDARANTLPIQNVSGCFSFAKYVNGWYEYADNTENGDVYNNVVTGRLMTEQQIFDEWLKLNNR